MEKKLTFKEKLVNKAKAAGQFVKDNWLDILIITAGSVAGAALGRACYNLGYSECKRENFTYKLPDWADKGTARKALDTLYDPEFYNDENLDIAKASVYGAKGTGVEITSTLVDNISKDYNPDTTKCRCVLVASPLKSEV